MRENAYYYIGLGENIDWKGARAEYWISFSLMMLRRALSWVIFIGRIICIPCSGKDITYKTPYHIQITYNTYHYSQEPQNTYIVIYFAWYACYHIFLSFFHIVLPIFIQLGYIGYLFRHCFTIQTKIETNSQDLRFTFISWTQSHLRILQWT